MDRIVPGTATKRGSDDPKGFEHESPEALASLLRLMPTDHPMRPTLTALKAQKESS